VCVCVSVCVSCAPIQQQHATPREQYEIAVGGSPSLRNQIHDLIDGTARCAIVWLQSAEKQRTMTVAECGVKSVVEEV
jgi:hypothetical protein